MTPAQGLGGLMRMQQGPVPMLEVHVECSSQVALCVGPAWARPSTLRLSLLLCCRRGLPALKLPGKHPTQYLVPCLPGTGLTLGEGVWPGAAPPWALPLEPRPLNPAP